MSAIEDANREIELAVRAEWVPHSPKPLLISKLGMNLSAVSKEALAETGIGLKRYIEDNLSDVIRVIPMKGRGGAVAPADQTIQLSDEEIEELFTVRSRQSLFDGEVPQYWITVWRGFQTEISENAVRYLLLEPFGRPRIIDAPIGSEIPENGKVIEKSDLVLGELDAPLPPRIAVQRAIENWCAREQVPILNLLYDRSSVRSKQDGNYARASRFTQGQTSSSSVSGLSLERGLALLSKDELARISIPADLVLTILERAKSR